MLWQRDDCFKSSELLFITGHPVKEVIIVSSKDICTMYSAKIIFTNTKDEIKFSIKRLSITNKIFQL